jgi:hypothetical protein
MKRETSPSFALCRHAAWNQPVERLRLPEDLRHAPDYEPDALRAAFPQPAIRRASEALIRIAQISEDKAMYDRREKAKGVVILPFS